MATKVIVPKLGMSTEPITLVEWKAKEGDRVEQGSVVLVVETEKIRHDVEAEASGFLHILVEAGKEAPIGSAAGLIVATKEELAALQKGEVVEVAAAEAKEEEMMVKNTSHFLSECNVKQEKRFKAIVMNMVAQAKKQ